METRKQNFIVIPDGKKLILNLLVEGQKKRVLALHILALNLKLPKLSIKNGSDCYCLGGGEMLLVPKLS